VNQDKYPERPLRLYRPEELPPVVRAYVLDERDDSLSFEPIPEDEQFILSSFFGHPVKTTMIDLWWHQFGGEPWLVQGQEEIVCPNPKCKCHVRGVTMKILAAVCNDPPGGLPMVESIAMAQADHGHFDRGVQVVFHICNSCFTVQASNRCD
jgi:hypothetical protein